MVSFYQIQLSLVASSNKSFASLLLPSLPRRHHQQHPLRSLDDSLYLLLSFLRPQLRLHVAPPVAEAEAQYAGMQARVSEARLLLELRLQRKGEQLRLRPLHEGGPLLQKHFLLPELIYYCS